MPNSNPTPGGLCYSTKTQTKRETNAVDRFVGERIRLYRTMLGVSQQKLAESLGVTFQQLQKYERGQNRIGAGRLLVVAETLEIPISFLLDEHAYSLGQDASNPAEADKPDLSREGYHVGRAFSQITDPEVRRSISSLVQSLARNEDDL